MWELFGRYFFIKNDEPHCKDVVENGVLYFVRSDHIGRPVFATDGTGTKVWTAAYLPFGGVRTFTGTPIELRFPGQWFQSESGLHQNWMREYDPTAGRYLQADPLGLVDGPSICGYARQNPGRYSDPTGEFLGRLGGALAGALFSGGLQYIINRVYGNMTRSQAFGCINLIPVATGAAFGANGLGLIGFLVKKQFTRAAASAATSGSFNSSAPPVYINERECGCELPDLPNWLKVLKNLALI